MQRGIKYIHDLKQALHWLFSAGCVVHLRGTMHGPGEPCRDTRSPFIYEPLPDPYAVKPEMSSFTASFHPALVTLDIINV
jgi:hypothetical protein